MNNNDNEIALRLLSMAPDDDDEGLEQQAPQHQELMPQAKGEEPISMPAPGQHKRKDIIPPVGIVKPEILESFMGNLDDEEKMKQEIKEVEDYHKENFLDTANREVKSYGLRALEGIGGTLGTLLNALSGEAYFDEQGQPVKGEVPMAPSAAELRKFTKEKTGNKYEPKTEFAKDAHEAATDIGAGLPLPGIGWFSKLLTPIFGQAVKTLFKSQGANEAQGDLAKNVFMMMSTIANLGNAPQMAKQAYQTATRMIPQGTRMSTRYLSQELNAVRNTPWYRTGRTAAKGPAFDEIDRIENAIQHGSMDLHEAMQIRRDINQARNRLGAFNYEPGIDKAAARQYLDRVDDVLRTNIERWGQANNPEWLNAYRQANQAVAVTQRSMKLQDYIRSNSTTKALQSETAKTLFHLGGASAILHSPSLLGGVAVAGAGAKGIQLINRMIRSPVLRNHYGDVVRAASIQNAGAMNNALKKFDEEAKKLEEETKNFKKK